MNREQMRIAIAVTVLLGTSTILTSSLMATEPSLSTDMSTGRIAIAETSDKTEEGMTIGPDELQGLFACDDASTLCESMKRGDSSRCFGRCLWYPARMLGSSQHEVFFAVPLGFSSNIQWAIFAAQIPEKTVSYLISEWGSSIRDLMVSPEREWLSYTTTTHGSACLVESRAKVLNLRSKRVLSVPLPPSAAGHLARLSSSKWTSRSRIEYMLELFSCGKNGLEYELLSTSSFQFDFQE